MFALRFTLALLSAIHVGCVGAQYNLARTFAGASFFNDWNYYGSYDNLTNGDVFWVNQATANTSRLTYVDPVTNHAFIRVDNSTRLASPARRNSVRINTNELYGIGTVWVGDLVHVPFGCSVWGAFWSTATEAEIAPAVWPTGGEIDLFEAYNLEPSNTFTLHTNPGCSITGNASQISALVNSTNCDSSTGGSGCTVTANDTRSYGEPFASAGGGVYVTEFASEGISMWFFTRDEVPKALGDNVSSVDTTALGEPSVVYPASSCAIDQLFKPQSLVFDITLCGPSLAGNPAIFNQTCAGDCYNDWVLGEPSNFDRAYFEIRSVRVFANPTAVIVPPVPQKAASASKATGIPTPTIGFATGGAAGVTRWPRAWGVSVIALFVASSIW